MVQSWRCVTESMFHSSDEKIVESSHSNTHFQKKLHQTFQKRKRKRKKERWNTSWMRRRGREAEVWQHEEEERRYSCPEGEKERKEGWKKRSAPAPVFSPSSHWPRVRSGSGWWISWAEAPPSFSPSSPLSGRVNGAKERDGAASLPLVLLGPPAERWGGQVGQECAEWPTPPLIPPPLQTPP